MALVVQKTGERQGNPAQTLYKLGRAQFKGTGPAVFHDVQAGDNTVPGTEGFPCTPGYDLATGLGSVDAQALVAAWNTGLGNNVDALIRQPAADLVVPCGTRIDFRGLAQDTSPSVAVTCAWDFGDGETGTGTAVAHAYRRTTPADAPFLVTFTATDATGATGSDTRNIRVIVPPPPGERLANGGFENGAAGWKARGVNIGFSPLEPPHAGTGSAWFAGWAAGTDSLLQQSVRLPDGPGPATLGFWLHIDSQVAGTRAYDSLDVKLRGADGQLRILTRFTNLDAAQGYQRHTLDLGAYRGQNVELSFVSSYNLLGRWTSFVLDDVSLIAP
jgi:hypothetical protein